MKSHGGPKLRMIMTLNMMGKQSIGISGTPQTS